MYKSREYLHMLRIKFPLTACLLFPNVSYITVIYLNHSEYILALYSLMAVDPGASTTNHRFLQIDFMK